jgi:MarR family transcriptional regulator, negative regulator of the multidrug operon emrRAB
MHTTPRTESNHARTANLLGAFALEAIGAQHRAIHGVLGQGGAAAAALVTTHKYPGRTVEELREPLGISQPGAARLVERLERSGWMERTGPGGRRGFELRLTSAGEEMFDRLLLARRAALEELLEPLSDEERDTLAGLLERLLGARTETHADTERLCRECERRVCRRCPVARAAKEARERRERAEHADGGRGPVEGGPAERGRG